MLNWKTKLIAELAGKSDAQSQNQLVRWVMNKEKHAEKIISTISDYFLTQRVKPSQKDYTERLIKHHTVIIAAMKAKQNADVKYAKTLKEFFWSIELAFARLYVWGEVFLDVYIKKRYHKDAWKRVESTKWNPVSQLR